LRNACEVLALEDAPLLQHRHHHVIEEYPGVKHAADSNDHGLAPEGRNGVPGHLEVAQHVVQ
jgi:hypothetical protein